jgi:hypothetical protein
MINEIENKTKLPSWRICSLVTTHGSNYYHQFRVKETETSQMWNVNYKTHVAQRGLQSNQIYQK